VEQLNEVMMVGRRGQDNWPTIWRL